jgi:glutaredoxin-related protein
MKDKEVILFSTHCPKCRALEILLKQHKVDYIENDNVDEMLSLGLTSAPGLKVGDNILSFPEAMKWVKEQ